MSEQNERDIWVHLNKILAVYCFLVLPVLFIGYKLQVKPGIWGVVAAVICFIVSNKIVKRFFSKKRE